MGRTVTPPASSLTSQQSTRDELLQIITEITAGRPQRDFRPYEVIERMKVRGTKRSVATIRFYLMSYMCAQAPHCRYCDVERIGPGLYRLYNDPRRTR